MANAHAADDETARYYYKMTTVNHNHVLFTATCHIQTVAVTYKY